MRGGQVEVQRTTECGRHLARKTAPALPSWTSNDDLCVLVVLISSLSSLSPERALVTAAHSPARLERVISETWSCQAKARLCC